MTAREGALKMARLAREAAAKKAAIAREASVKKRAVEDEMALKKKALAEQEAHKLARRDAAAKRTTSARVEGQMRARMDAADVEELEKRLKETGAGHARHGMQSSTDSWEQMAASKTQAAWADADQVSPNSEPVPQSHPATTSPCNNQNRPATTQTHKPNTVQQAFP